MIRLFYVALLLISISSCAPVRSAYTQKLHDRFEWKEADLKKVQFYLSEDIVLRRHADGEGKAEIALGHIKIIDGTRYEIVKFKKGTPGVLLFMPKENRMAVSFEGNGSNDNFLMFGPNPNYSNRYVLLASDWNKQAGEVTYQGKKWTTGSQSAFAGLVINLKKVDQNNTAARVAKGRTVE
jgi:hypothetical protein